MSVGYKANLSNPNKVDQYHEKEIDASELDDPQIYTPQIDLPHNISIDMVFLKDSIETAYENYYKKDYDNLIGNFKFWEKTINLYHNFLTTSFFRETDFCAFLIRIASNNQHLPLRNYAILIITILVDISSDSIDEFIDSFGMDLFIQISRDQIPSVRLNAYQILFRCLNSPKGVDAFLNKKVIEGLIYTFGAFLEHQELSEFHQESIMMIAEIFVKLLKYANHDEFPKDLPETLLNILIQELKIDFSNFFYLTFQAAAMIVFQMKDEGNKLIIKSKLLDDIELNLLKNDEQIMVLVDLLMMIFSQKNQYFKKTILEKLPKHYLTEYLFKNVEINTKIYLSLMNTICNCFIIGLDCTWIVQIKSIEKFNEVYDQGDYQSKEVTTKCLLMAMYFADTVICEQLLESDLLTLAVQSIECFSNNDSIIKILKILNEILEKIYRNELNKSFDLDDEIANVLQNLLNYDDERIVQISELMLQNYFPDIYFDQ